LKTLYRKKDPDKASFILLQNELSAIYKRRVLK